MLSRETISGINKRIRSLNPTWMLVGGPELGELNFFRDRIALVIFVDVFYKQLNGDANRRKEDLVQIAYDAVKHMKLAITKPLAEKIIDSLMWSERKDFAVFSFRALTFNEETDKWEEHRYQYFTLDREFSDLDNQIEVFKLSEEAEEIVIKSQEMMEEFDITIQGIVTELLIKRGKFEQALSALQILDVKVRRLILREEEHKKQILKDPKGAIYIDEKKWGDSLTEVHQQFQEELSRYDEMERMLKYRLEKDPSNNDITKLFYRISFTRREHDKLAKLVIGNIQKEFQFRSNPALFTLLWRPNEGSFRESVMNDIVVPKGLRDPEDGFRLMNLLFSPKKGFIYPIQWMIREQGSRDKSLDFEKPGGHSDGESAKKLDIDWEEIVDLWTPVIIELMNRGEVSNNYLLGLSDIQAQRWVDCREAMDMWILFLMGGRKLATPKTLSERTNDQRAKLIKKVVEKNQECKELLGIEIHAETLDKPNLLIEKQVEIVPITLTLNELE